MCPQVISPHVGREQQAYEQECKQGKEGRQASWERKGQGEGRGRARQDEHHVGGRGSEPGTRRPHLPTGRLCPWCLGEVRGGCQAGALAACLPVFPISCFNLQQRQQELTLWAGSPLWLWAAQGRGLPPQLPSSVANRSSAPGPALSTEQLGSPRQLCVALCCETPAVSHFLCHQLRNLGAGTRQYQPMSVNSLRSPGEGPHLEGRRAGQGRRGGPVVTSVTAN